MGLFIAGRLLASVPVLAGVLVLVFAMLWLAPGDPASLLAGETATREEIEALRQRLGFDRSPAEAFLAWSASLLQGDFGRSMFSGQPVLTLIGARIEPTLVLATSALVLSTTIAVPLGILAARFCGGAIDRAISVFSSLAFAVPAFLVGLSLVYIFSLTLGWFPVQGYVSPFERPLRALGTLVLPTVTLAAVLVALIARTTRAAMLDVMQQDFVRTARSKGASEWRTLFVHALHVAALPVVTVIGVSFAALLGGVVLTETVFNIPGIGRLTVDSIQNRDYPVIQGVLLLAALAKVLVNLLVDVSYSLLDPRIRLGREAAA